MNVVAIIQARLGSTRLPGKVLEKLVDKPMLEHVVTRVRRSKMVDLVVVATTTSANDERIVDFCKQRGIRHFQGSENDVLDRYFQSAIKNKADHIVRITADCPIIDPKRIDEVVEAHLSLGADYTANTVVETFPDGQDCEIFTLAALEQSWQLAELTSEREHVTQYIKKHPEKYKIENVSSPTDLSAHRWTVDDREDLDFIGKIYDELYAANNFFTMEEVLDLLEKKPELKKYNYHIERNAGLKKSLLNDKKGKK